MDRTCVIAGVGIIGLLMGQEPAEADNVQVRSKIAEINVTAGYFKVYRLDQQTEKTEEIKVDVDSSTRFQGVEALRDLKNDDEVSIQANYDAFNHEWKALKITYEAPSPLIKGPSTEQVRGL